MADPDRKLDAWTDAARQVPGEDRPNGVADHPDDPRLRALHAALREPPSADETPDLVPIVMARIARRSATAPAVPHVTTESRSPAGGFVARLRDALSRVAVGPVLAVGSLAAVLAVALWSAGDAGTAGRLSGAATGVAVPGLLGVALVALGVGLAVAWLRHR